MASGVAGLRVLHVGPLYVNHVWTWSERAAALGCAVHVAGHVKPGRPALDPGGIAASVDIAPDGPSEPDTARHRAWLRELLGDLRPDLVQAHWLATWGNFAVASGHERVAASVWGSDIYLLGGYLARRARDALAGAARVVAQSDHMGRAAIAQGAPPSRVAVVDLGVDLQRFQPASPAERARLRRELGLPPGPVVLSLRAGTELYNLDVVVEGFRRLRSRFEDATLVLMPGDAPLCEPARAALARLEGEARIVRRVAPAELPRYMRAADVGISIPSSDGSPNSVWQSLSCGLPVVLSDLPQMRERVVGCAATRPVEPRPAEVARAIEELLAGGDGVAVEARAWAVRNVDYRDELPRLERLYAAMARTPAGAPAR
jgi:glycosyltransferase involved in cell wall biosynthesis